jgi:hypothetical protein
MESVTRSQRRAIAGGAIAAAAVILHVGSAAAQDTSVRGAAAARALFREGVDCADRADWPCAVDRFSRAYGLRASPVIGSNYGRALIEVGRLVEGTELLRQVARDESAATRLRTEARAAADAVAPRIGTVTVHVAGSREGVELRMDGHDWPLSLIDASTPIDPGDHTLEARRGGEVVASATVHVGEGGAGEVSIDVPSPPEPEPIPAAVDLEEEAEERVDTSLAEARPQGGDDGVAIGLGVTAGVLVAGAAVVLTVFLLPPSEAAPFAGTLGTVELGR